MKENENRLVKMSAVDIVDYSVEVYKRNFKKLTIMTLILYVPFALIYVIISGFLTKDLNSLTADRGSSFSIIMAYLFVSVGLLFFYLCYFLTINGVLQAAISKFIYNDVVYGKTLGVKEVIKGSFRKMHKILGYRLLFYLIMTGAIMAAVAVFYILLLVFAFSSLTTVTATQGLSNVGSVVMAIIMIILFIAFIFGAFVILGVFYIRFGFGVQAISIEDKGATEGISRSAELSRKMFWKSFLAFFLGSLIYCFFPFLSMGLSVLLSFLDKELYNQIQIVSTSFVQLGYAVFYPFIATLTTMIFINYKISNEGLDLELKVDNLLMGGK
ncbi:MAG: hypothetical protein Q8942_01100 [Bacillota bacterium]|nr:hypothetical protein [Bacillota bacterium]